MPAQRHRRTSERARQLPCILRLACKAALFTVLVQTGGSHLASAQDAAVTPSMTVAGHVLNALNGTPIPRALVSMGGRRVLTDALGRFEFPEFTGRQARASVTKPGYTQSLDPEQALSGQTITQFSSNLELVLYPDAIVSGTVTGVDGEPLARVPVSLLRESPNDSALRSLPSGFTQTDSHGSYRFEAQPGFYRVRLSYAPRLPDTGEAMLPLEYPEQSGTDRPAVFTLAPGESRQVDLQPRTSQAYPISLHLDAETAGAGLQVICSSTQGGSFTVFAQPSRTQGEYHLDLPSGSYQLHAILNSREGQQEAIGKVTVSGRPAEGPVMHLAPVPQISVELIVDSDDPSATATPGSATVPRLSQFNLRLRPAGPTELGAQNDLSLFASADRTNRFQTPSGIYRLQGQQSGDWYIKSASYGSSDLLTDKLLVAPGAGGEIIRITASRSSGQVSGNLLSNGASPLGVVYLIAHEAGLNPIRTLRVTSGTFKTTLPPGTYTLVALSSPFAGDLSSAAVVASLGGTQTVQVTPGGTATADLTVQTQKDRP